MTCAAGQHGVHIQYVCACYRYVHVCVGVFQMYSYTLQVPMQPTGLSGRPLNPSFLLMARKRYACRKTHTNTHTHTYSQTQHSHCTWSYCQPFCCQRKLKSTSLSVHFPRDRISVALRLKIPHLIRNVMPHSVTPYRNENASPSSACPTETFLLLQLISWNYHHMAEPPTDISSV